LNTYPEDLFESIEFDLVKQAIIKRAVSERARERIAGLRPSSDYAVVLRDLQEVHEVLGLYQSDFGVPALASEDIKPFLLRLKIQGATLEGEDFLILKNMIESFNRVYSFFKTHSDRTPSMQSKLAHLSKNKTVPDEIDRVLDRRGVVKTSASPALGKIRSALAKKRAAADRIFYRAVKKYSGSGMLADIQESVHDNKRVLAIEGAFKGQVNGVFHGSSSKATIFYVEPSETLEINNEIAVLEDEEKREVTRILRLLTAFVAGYRDEVRDYSTALYQIDFVNAKALYALAEEACLPQLTDKPHVHLIKAINPVLRAFNAPKEKGVVPLDIRLDTHTRILVISGPNAGGKSITLKTVGLLQLMLQSGMLVTVHPDSTMGWFNGLMADIGDSQSIENELSTYSSKLTKMNHFLNAAYGKTLVLIDEFGSGSDPDLGSSMAQVFLKELNNSKTFGVMTTHYNSIKALAGELVRVENGSMQFNSTDLTPEYVLNQGVPGSSYTYEVAQKVGVSRELIDQARDVLDESTVAVDRLLVGIQKEKNELTRQREKLAQRLEELEQLKEKQDRKISQLEDKVRRQSAMNEQQNAMITWGKKFQNLVNEYAEQRSKKGKDEVVGRFKVYAGERASQTSEERDVKKSKYQKQKERKIKKLIATPAKVGDRVKLIGSRQPGEIVEIKKDQYLLSIGALSTWVTRDKFIPAESLHGDSGTVKGKARGGVQEPQPVVETPAVEEAPKSPQEQRNEKKRAKQAVKSGSENAGQQPRKSRSRKSKPKTARPAEQKAAPEAAKVETPELTTAEKLAQVAEAAPLKSPAPKKAVGKQKELTPEQKAQLAKPVRKVGSPKAKEEESEAAKKDATDADLEKLKAFFGKK
jgi:DNA mismatch repair protein MutS2